MLSKATAALGLVLAISLPALGGNTVTQTVVFEVRQISEMSVSGSPGNLLIETASGGSGAGRGCRQLLLLLAHHQRLRPEDHGAGWTATMPAGNGTGGEPGARPAGPAALGDVPLSTAAADLVTSISRVAEGPLGITYTFSAAKEAGTVPGQSKTVTFTLTNP